MNVKRNVTTQLHVVAKHLHLAHKLEVTMIQPSVLVIGIIALAPSAYLDKPLQEAKHATYYYPTKVGTKRVYVNGKGAEISNLVTAIDTHDNEIIVSIATLPENDLSAVFPHFTVKVSQNGVYRISENDDKYSDPVCVLKLPHKPGDTWKTCLLGQSRLQSKLGSATAEKREDVIVPAGRFVAIRVEFVGVKDGRPHRQTDWFAPGVGIVKSVTGPNDADKLELKSIEQGK